MLPPGGKSATVAQDAGAEPYIETMALGWGRWRRHLVSGISTNTLAPGLYVVDVAPSSVLNRHLAEGSETTFEKLTPVIHDQIGRKVEIQR